MTTTEMRPQSVEIADFTHPATHNACSCHECVETTQETMFDFQRFITCEGLHGVKIAGMAVV